MDALECIATRRSIRRFKDKKVDKEKLLRILDAGRLAPNAGNLQDWRFILVLEEDQIKKIADACLEQIWLETAPLLIIVCGDTTKGEAHYGERGKKVYTLQNATAATQNMLLAAHAQELGACWIGAFVEEKLRELMSIPANAVIAGIIAIGYPDEEPEKQKKLEIENVTYFHKWGNVREERELWAGEYSEYLHKKAKQIAHRIKRKGKEAIEHLRKKKLHK